MTSARTRRLAERLVAVASVLVPRDRRTDWVREWRGELWARYEAGRPVLWPAMGAFRHAAWHRRDAWAVGASRGLQELRVAVRGLVRRPTFTLAVVATLGLGVAATTSVFGVVDTVLMAPLPYPGGDRLVQVSAEWIAEGFDPRTLNPDLYVAWSERTMSIEDLEAFAVFDRDFLGDGRPRVVRAADVTAGLFSELLAVRPVLGRGFTAADNGAPPSQVALISERLWQVEYGRSADVLGRSLRVDGDVKQVVGVLPTIAILPDVDVWTPVELKAPTGVRARLGPLTAIGRRRTGLTLEQVQNELTAVGERAGEEVGGSVASFRPQVRDYREALVGDVGANLWMLMGAVAVVLLIGCVNVSNLLLTRATERARELTVRHHLGASTSDLVRPVLIEGLTLCVIGGAVGLILALAIVRWLGGRIPDDIPLAATASIDERTLLFALAITTLTGLVFSIVPALRAGRVGSEDTAGRSSSRGPRARCRGALLMGLEVAQASALLVAAFLMVNTLVRMSRADAGFDPEGLLFVHLELPPWSYGPVSEPDRRNRFIELLREEVRALRGVRTVGVATATPFSGMTFLEVHVQEGGPRPGATSAGIELAHAEGRVAFSTVWIGQDYLSTLGLPLLEGRSFHASDFGGPPVALVNTAAARAYWPGERVVGRRLRVEDDEPWTTIVGVVGNLTHPGLPTEGMAELYRPLERPTRNTHALIRFVGEPEPLQQAVREGIWSIDPELPIPALRTANEELSASLAMTRLYTVFLGVFAALALLLTAVGIYGVMAYSVARRTREMGIRMALGADRAGVAARVLREAMGVVGAGLVVGLGAAAVGSRFMERLLYGVTPVDGFTYAAVAASIAAVAAAATLGPARRATRADPIDVLKAE